jgi:hypothetical protein
MKVNKGAGTPNGPHFEVAPGVVLRAHTFDLLYPMITEYRMRHGIPPGNAEADVDAFVCAKWPHMCQPESGDGPTPEMRGRKMSGRIAAWAALKAREMPVGGYALVDDGVALERATACQTCPYNRAWKTDCAPCNATSEALLGVIRRLRRVKIDNSLLGCEVCGNDINTAVFMPDETVKPSDIERPRLPPGCWIKKL